jgi:hypothetical protein
MRSSVAKDLEGQPETVKVRGDAAKTNELLRDERDSRLDPDPVNLTGVYQLAGDEYRGANL